MHWYRLIKSHLHNYHTNHELVQAISKDTFNKMTYTNDFKKIQLCNDIQNLQWYIIPKNQ